MINTVSKEHEGRQIMDINWSRYIEIARAQDLGSAEVARLIRTETRRKVNIVPPRSGSLRFGLLFSIDGILSQLLVGLLLSA